MDKIIANFSHYIIPNYELGDCRKLEKMLSVYVPRRFSYKIVGFVYDEEKREMRIPRGFPANTLSALLGRPIEVNETPQEFEKMKINLLQEPREKLQISAIAFLCGLGRKYEYTRKHSQVFCDLNTGKGKTYCATAAMSHFKHKTVIFIPSRISKLSKQWIDSIIKHTDKKSKKILDVVGSKMCLEVLEGEHDDKDIFVFNRATVLSFAKNYGWDKFQEMIEATKTGVKIVDEAHLDFATNVKIDCYTNIKRNIYLTSSAGRGNDDEDKIFKRVFDTVPIMGKELTSVEDNYIIMIVFKFFHTPSEIQRLQCKTREGLSSALYSSYLVDRDGAREQFFTALDKALKTIYLKYKDDDGKLLILGSTKEILREIKDFLEEDYSEYSIGMYTSDIPDKKKREKELEKEIILATEKGLGTGADIENLQFMINIVPYSNKVYADQLTGRLRDIGKNVFYIELVNDRFPEASGQFARRSRHLGKKAKDGKIIVVDVD